MERAQQPKCSHCCHHCDSHASCLDIVPIFASLSLEEKAEIAEISSSRTYEKGEMIYSAGDEGGTLFVLYTGRAKLFRLNISGKEQVLRLVEPESFSVSFHYSHPYLTDYAQALEETTMCT